MATVVLLECILSLMADRVDAADRDEAGSRARPLALLGLMGRRAPEVQSGRVYVYVLRLGGEGQY